MAGLASGIGTALMASGAAGGAGAAASAGGSFLPQILELLKQSSFSVQKGGRTTSFSGGAEDAEREAMLKKLMEILGSPRGIGSASPIIQVGGQDTGIQLDTPIGGGGGGSFLDRPASLSMAPFFR